MQTPTPDASTADIAKSHKQTCGAKCRDGHLCPNDKLMANGRCRMHGGKSLSGPASPSWKHGGRSRALPTRLRAKVEEARGDQELLGLNHEVAITAARHDELMGSLDERAPDALWGELYEAWQEYTYAEAEGDGQETRKAAHKLGRLIEEGATEKKRWDDILRYQKHKAFLTEKERKREMELGMFIPLAQMQAYTLALVGIIARYVSDRDILQNISDEVRQLDAR